MGLTRRALTAGCTALALLALPAVASATARTGQAIDAAGDGAGSPSQDIAGAAAAYDDATGAVNLAVGFNGAVNSAPRTAISFTVGSFTAPDQCGGPGVTLAGFSDSYAGTVTLSEGGAHDRHRLPPVDVDRVRRTERRAQEPPVRLRDAEGLEHHRNRARHPGRPALLRRLLTGRRFRRRGRQPRRLPGRGRPGASRLPARHRRRRRRRRGRSVPRQLRPGAHWFRAQDRSASLPAARPRRRSR